MHKPKLPKFEIPRQESDRQAIQGRVDDVNEAAKRAGRLMVFHPIRGEVITAQAFEAEMAARHELRRPASEFWAPLPIAKPTE